MNQFQTHQSIFYILPETLQLLDIPLSIHQLSHFKVNPRAGFNLKQLVLHDLETDGEEEWNQDISLVLPAVEVIVYQFISLEGLDYLLSKWDSIVPKCIKGIIVRLVVTYCWDREYRMKENESRIRAFREIGIDLKIMNTY